MKLREFKEILREEVRKALQEMEFANQKNFDAYNKAHTLRPTTKVTIAGKSTTAGQAAGKSVSSNQPVKGANLFKQNADSGLGWGPENDRTSVTQLPKKASDLDDSHADVISKAMKNDAGIKGTTDIDDNSGAIRFTSGDGDEPTYTLYFGANDDYGKPDEFRVTLEPTYGNDPANLDGKYDKAFKSPKDAMSYMITVAKKHRKELQMDDSDN